MALELPSERRPPDACAGFPFCDRRALPGKAGCVRHQPIYDRVRAALHPNRKNREPKVSPAPVVVTQTENGAELVVAAVRKHGTLKLAELVEELKVPRRTASRWATDARAKGLIVVSNGSRAGYELAGNAPLPQPTPVERHRGDPEELIAAIVAYIEQHGRASAAELATHIERSEGPTMKLAGQARGRGLIGSRLGPGGGFIAIEQKAA